MSYTLTNGAATKIVESAWQKDELVQRGWAESAGGSAGTAPDINDFTNPTPKDFKGVGFVGEDPASIAYEAKKAAAGGDQTKYEAMDDIIKKFGSHVPNATTYSSGISVVATLPTTSQSATTVYLLTAKDTTAAKDPGVYKWNSTSSAWEAYTI